MRQNKARGARGDKKSPGRALLLRRDSFIAHGLATARSPLREDE